MNLIVFLAVFLPLLTIFLSGARSTAFDDDEKGAAYLGALVLSFFIAIILSNPQLIGTLIAFHPPEEILPRIFSYIFGGMMVIIGFLIVFVYFFSGITFIVYKVRSWMHGPIIEPNWNRTGTHRRPAVDQHFRPSRISQELPSPTNTLIRKLIQPQEVDSDEQ